MPGVHLLDRMIGAAWPSLATAADVAALEAVPWPERRAAESTYQALQLGAAHDPNAAALRFLPKVDPAVTPVTVSHRDFVAQVTRAANLFTALGVGRDDVVSFLLPLIPEAFYTLFGAEAAGVANPVNPLLEPWQIAEILAAANTRVLVALGPVPGSDIWDKVLAIKDQLPNLKAVVVVHGPHRPEQGIHAWEVLANAAAGDRLSSGRQIGADDTAALFHTGGTTGTPKLVRHSHANQVYQAWVIGLMLRAQPGRNLLFGLPLFHVGGALTQGLATFATGGCAVVLGPRGWRDPDALAHVWRLVETYRPPTLGGVPTVLAAALQVPVAGADVSSIERVSGGGSAIPVAVGQAYAERLHVPVLEVYGMTETASVHTISYLDREIRLGAVGQAVPYSRVRVVKVDGAGTLTSDCATNEIGVVAMSGPGVFAGYVDTRHSAGAFVAPGWVNSGDLGRLDAEGYLWITGRAKDLIIRGGHNIDPQPVEEILYRHPAVALAALVGQPDAYAGELPLAFVQFKPGHTAPAEEIIDFIRARTPERAAVPVDVVAIDPMPLTAVGKVYKPSLRHAAARRVIERLLADLATDGVGIGVEVALHATHGTLATVAVRGVAAAAQATIGAEVTRRLGPLTLRHAVEFS